MVGGKESDAGDLGSRPSDGLSFLCDCGKDHESL